MAMLNSEYFLVNYIDRTIGPQSLDRREAMAYAECRCKKLH